MYKKFISDLEGHHQKFERAKFWTIMALSIAAVIVGVVMLLMAKNGP